ncbi:MAG: CDP-diacylglycerol--serine O-phosphatidyltransferase [Sphingobacteriaceae bacterium]|nr:MAG: CDP-diacylglycerol--serine O-phosphatidyltransferase [Pedobacter sp.]
MKKYIPNGITCLNLFSGCLGIVYAFQGELKYASLAILTAAIFDFFDGLSARVLQVYSDMGKELDSLADMVSFGLLPSVMVYQLFLLAPQVGCLKISAFIIAIFSALRLAKFNLDVRQTENFIGLPTPANALLVASLPMIIADENACLTSWILNPFFLLGFSVVMSFLLIAELPLLSLKFKNLSVSDNLLRYSLILSSLILLVIFRFAAVPIIILVYILLSIIQFRLLK